MADPLRGIGSGTSPIARTDVRPAGEGEAGKSRQIDFQNVLFQSLDQVNRLDAESQNAIAQGLAGGGEGELTQAEIFMAVKKADLAFRTMLQIRNKVLEAYNEIKQMRM